LKREAKGDEDRVVRCATDNPHWLNSYLDEAVKTRARERLFYELVIKSLRSRLADAMSEFEERTKTTATDLFITREQAKEFLFFPRGEWGSDLAKKFEAEGVESVPRICGMKVHWNAPEFKIESHATP
jgi:hypothetical protein